jgi:hypothetical protein
VTPVLWMRDILAGAEAFTALTRPFLTSCILLRGGPELFFLFSSFLDGLFLTSDWSLDLITSPRLIAGDSLAIMQRKWWCGCTWQQDFSCVVVVVSVDFFLL